MKHTFLFLITLFMACSLNSCQQKPVKAQATTICNPVNLSYRFCLNEPSRREAADPSIVLFEGEYYLFASKSGGYFHSKDLVTWDLITTIDLPLEVYAPTAWVIDNEIYFYGRSHFIYKTAQPKLGKWEVVNDSFPLYSDPMMFPDNDGRVYCYYGCSDEEPIMAVELDRNDRLNPIGKPVECIAANSDIYGWERTGDNNDGTKKTWIEGAWMNKYKGRYYLQYATPGTEFKSYADAVYVADSPLGPFTLAKTNPFAYKPEGFANGAGHGSTFQDKYGNYWHIGTVSISVKHMFERRLSLFPVSFDTDGEMLAHTTWGDYPMYMPDSLVTDASSLYTGWMLLSYNKPVEVSSSVVGHEASLAVDEEIRSYWSAATGNSGEYITVDLGGRSTVYALQINIAEHNTTILGHHNRPIRYLLEHSKDGKTWQLLVDKSNNLSDVPHDYVSLPSPVETRFIRLTNVEIPDGCFAVSGLRVFGKCANRTAANAVTSIRAERQPDDRRIVHLNWEQSPEAMGYLIHFGTQPDKLYQHYMVYGINDLIIKSLHAGEPYYFTIDAFNESGITQGGSVTQVL
jgi:hypothetical protein